MAGSDPERPAVLDAGTPGRWPRSEGFYEWLRDRLIPDLQNSQHLYADRLRELAGNGRAWLDLGCGHSVVPPWATGTLDGLAPMAGIDPDWTALRKNTRVRWKAVATGEALPFTDAVFDVVTANMVLEHVAAPETLFAEVARVLKPGGCFLIHTPNRRGYTTLLTRLIPPPLRRPLATALHDRRGADVYPTHYRANSGAQLQRLATRCHLDVRSLEYVLSSPQLVRIPPLLVVEMLVIRVLSSRGLSALRPCLLAIFERRGPA